VADDVDPRDASAFATRVQAVADAASEGPLAAANFAAYRSMQALGAEIAAAHSARLKQSVDAMMRMVAQQQQPSIQRTIDIWLRSSANPSAQILETFRRATASAGGETPSRAQPTVLDQFLESAAEASAAAATAPRLAEPSATVPAPAPPMKVGTQVGGDRSDAASVAVEPRGSLLTREELKLVRDVSSYLWMVIDVALAPAILRLAPSVAVSISTSILISITTAVTVYVVSQRPSAD
jgi:hypothetical protein